MNLKKIIILFSVIFILILSILLIFINKKSDEKSINGRWISKDDSIIRVITAYKNGQPVYSNENIIEYCLEIKKEGSYIIYFKDGTNKDNSNYEIENNIIEQGKYSINPNDENMIYFDSDNKNQLSGSFIWNCKLYDGNNLYECTNYAYEFVKQ